VVAIGLAQGGERIGEQAEFTAHGDAGRARRSFHGCDLRRRQPGAAQHQLLPLDEFRTEFAVQEAGLRKLLAQQRELRGRLARVRHRHLRALLRAPARHGQPGGAAAEDEDGLVAQFHHRSFSVDRPIRHSSIVMIQKRITTCVSFQPVFSK
jgi:hypothetical protein